MESSRRDLLSDMAEHRPILKNNGNTNQPRFGFTLETAITFPKTGFCFYCVFYSIFSVFKGFCWFNKKNN